MWGNVQDENASSRTLAHGQRRPPLPLKWHHELTGSGGRGAQGISTSSKRAEVISAGGPPGLWRSCVGLDCRSGGIIETDRSQIWTSEAGEVRRQALIGVHKLQPFWQNTFDTPAECQWPPLSNWSTNTLCCWHHSAMPLTCKRERERDDWNDV